MMDNAFTAEIDRKLQFTFFNFWTDHNLMLWFKEWVNVEASMKPGFLISKIDFKLGMGKAKSDDHIIDGGWGLKTAWIT